MNKERRKSVVDVVVTFLTTIAKRRLCRDGCVSVSHIKLTKGIFNI